MTTNQSKLIAWVNQHGGIFATPCGPQSIWIYIPGTQCDRGAAGNWINPRPVLCRELATNYREARAVLGY